MKKQKGFICCKLLVLMIAVLLLCAVSILLDRLPVP